MLRNIAAAALRNLARNRLYAAISIAGLTLGLAAVILTALYVRDELAFDSFIPGHERVFVVTSTVREPGQADMVMDYAPYHLAANIKLAFPQAEGIARLAYDQVSVRRSDMEAAENVAWVDPTFFDVLALPSVAGDPRRAMDDPAGLVITRGAARRYFGREDVVGETLQFNRTHTMRIGAVLQDLPAATHLTQEVFASGRSASSPMSRLEHTARGPTFANYIVTRLAEPPGARFEPARLRTYVRLAPADISQAPAKFRALPTGKMADLAPSAKVSFNLVPLSNLHLTAFKGANLGATDPRGSAPGLFALMVTASLVLALAVINFVNLTTARAARRAVEVGIRKVAGAQRRHLVIQFVGEAFAHALLAVVLALALVELLLPVLNAFLTREMTFPYWRQPGAIALLAALTLGVGLVAGAYPAFVLSVFRPAGVLKGGALEAAGSGLVRQGLVIFQFAVLIALIVAVAVVWRQTRFAMSEGLRLDKGQVLVVYATPCRGPFEAEVRRLPGVRAAGCSSLSMLGLAEFDPTTYVMNANAPGGPEAHLDLGLIDFGLLELYGVAPVAGRLFDRPSDELPPQPDGGFQTGSVLLNEAAARKLGFASPSAAVNRRISVGPGYGEFTAVGVVPDFTLDLVNAVAKPTVYVVDFANYPADQVLNVKLDGARIPETTAAIDRLWKSTGRSGAIRRQFLDDYVQRVYLGTLRQGWLVGVMAAMAVFLAVFGLLGLAAFTAERRTKEIGVRKAMGASSTDILRLLVWQFTKPVLWANLIAWPVAWIAMDWWLKGFAYRIPLTPWIFAAAALAALAIAWATVVAHALQAARARPVDALRYE